MEVERMGDCGEFRPGGLVLAVFGLNMVFGLVAALTLMIFLFAGENAFAMMGAVLFLPALVFVVWIQFRAILGLGAELAGYIFVVGGFFAAFGVAVNFFKAFENTRSDIRFLVLLCGVGGLVFLYMMVCAFAYRRWGRRVKEFAAKGVDVHVGVNWAKNLRWVLTGAFLIASAAGSLIGSLRLGRVAEFAEHVESVDWLPASASDISYYKSYSYTAYEFDISEEDFLAWAKDEGYEVYEVGDEWFMIRRYNIYEEYEPRRSEDGRVCCCAVAKVWFVQDGYAYEEKSYNGGGVRVGYDRRLERAFYQSNPR